MTAGDSNRAWVITGLACALSQALLIAWLGSLTLTQSQHTDTIAAHGESIGRLGEQLDQPCNHK